MKTFVACKWWNEFNPETVGYILFESYPGHQTPGPKVEHNSIPELAVSALRYMPKELAGDYRIIGAIRADGIGLNACSVQQKIVRVTEAFSAKELGELVLEIERLKAEKK